MDGIVEGNWNPESLDATKAFWVIFIFGRLEVQDVTDNAVKTAGGADLYLHDIYYYADEYIQSELDGDKESATDSFVDMILYISDRITKPGTEDIELLDSIFNVYVRLCTKYKVLPTLEVFSFLVDINRSTFSTWISGEYRASTGHSDTAKKWFNICKSFTVNRLHNKGGTDANLIFIAKAAYGMAETAPIQTAGTAQRVLTAEELPKLGGGEVKMLDVGEDGG